MRSAIVKRRRLDQDCPIDTVSSSNRDIMFTYVTRSAEGLPHLLKTQESIPSERWPLYSISNLLDTADPDIESLCTLADQTSDQDQRATLINSAERLSCQLDRKAVPTGAPLRSWELTCTGAGLEHLDNAVTDALTTILERFDAIHTLSVDTDTGTFHATRSRPTQYTQDVDEALISVFSRSPHFRAVTFSGAGGADGRIATPQDPFWSPHGMEIDRINHERALGIERVASANVDGPETPPTHSNTAATPQD